MRRARATPQARRALRWAITWFALAQLAAVAMLEWKHPEFYDPKYGCRLAQLRRRISEAPGRPLVLILGSSRAEQGFRPGLLPEAGDRSPLLFNLARGGSSPLLHLITLRRLLADGIHPDCVLLEIFPPSLVEPDGGLVLPKTTLRDLPVLQHYGVSPTTYAYFLRDRACLWYWYRSGFLADYGPAGLTGSAWGKDLWNVGGEWREISVGATSEERRIQTAEARRRYFNKLQRFHISAGADRALRDFLAVAREQDIRVVLFLMPEASEFRGWYTPAAQSQLADYLQALRQQYGTPILDAREWIPDDEFWDSHHLLLGGATAFTSRLDAELESLMAAPGEPSDLISQSSRPARAPRPLRSAP